jgi:hypothetical protein
MPADSEALLLSKFEKVFTHFHNPHKYYGSNRLFQSDLKEALEKDAAYTAKLSLQGLLTATQLVINSWEKDSFRQRQRAELGVDTKRKGPPTSTISKKRTRTDATSNPDHLKATVGEHCQGCGRPRYSREECRGRDIPGWNSEGRWIDSKAYKAADTINIANGNEARQPAPTRSCSPASRLLTAGLQVRPRRQEQQVQDHPLLRPCRQASQWQQRTWR